MAASTRAGDLCSGHDSHPARSLVSGQYSSDVKVNGKGIVREDDTWVNHCDSGGHNCHTSAVEASASPSDGKGGSSSVFVNGKRAVRVGDHITKNGCTSTVAQGSSDVFIGDIESIQVESIQTVSIIRTSINDSPFNLSLGVIKSVSPIFVYIGYAYMIESGVMYLTPPIGATSAVFTNLSTYTGLQMYVKKIKPSREIAATYGLATDTITFPVSTDYTYLLYAYFNAAPIPNSGYMVKLKVTWYK